MQFFNDFEEWSKIANNYGWVHCHDNFVVVDNPDNDECLGEFDSETGEGWIICKDSVDSEM